MVDSGDVPILEARGITKNFGHVEALRGTDFSARAGEITALIGDNGAGKSTLVKILSGVYRATAGEILIHGKRVHFDSPAGAHAAGIETVYQDLSVAQDLSPAANMFMGRERLRSGLLGRLGFLDNAAMRRESLVAFDRLKVSLKDMDTPISSLSGGQRQSVAICRAIMWARSVVFMDEPTAALGVVQTGRTLDLVRRIRDTGIAVVFISHNMRDVLKVADTIEVLRLGRRIARLRNDGVTVQDLVGAMTGALDAEEGAAA
ncbi:MAG: sugar ABC transporter ATP-binding protein [Rhodospirillales bacterium]|nr:ATP-binding cassette domain-containing protein [Rhodospirillales bacterium]MDE2200510.1 sugar ABC transporter ATP-binding protein [Rhodospirillales bacterium]MDE2576806.1 sugar ABC transporter ATP-binding protein [Rhodospirillales bacterium]